MSGLLRLRRPEHVWALGLFVLHFLVGAGLARGLNLEWRPVAAAALLFGLLLGGAILLESARRVALALLAASLCLSALFLRLRPGGKYFFEIVLTGVLLSGLYFLAPIRLRARAGWDLFVPCLGLGFFTPMAGWCATGRGLERGLVDLCVGFFFLLGALGLLYQWGQTKPGISSKDGLTYALGAILVAHLWFAQVLLRAHAPLAPLLLSLGAWLGVALPWRLRALHWTEAQALAGWRRALGAWVITDLSFLLLLGPR